MWSRADRLVRDACRSRWLVFLRDGGQFSGLLADADERTAEFADVRLVQSNGTVPADGRLLIERDRIAYLQRDGG